MQTTHLVPLFNTNKIEETKAFYTSHLGFKVIIEQQGYLQLGNGSAQLAFMPPLAHDPDSKLASGNGICYCLSVKNVDSEYERLVAEGVEITTPPENHPWGDRGMTFKDPNGITVYLSQPLQPAVESKA